MTTKTKTETQAEAKAQPETNIDRLVTQVKAAHAATVTAYRKSLDNAHRAGKLLTELKAIIDAKDSPYSWAKWVEPNTGIGERTANNYIRVAKDWEKIEAKLAAKGGADGLTMTGALALLRDEATEGEKDDKKKKLTTSRLRERMEAYGIGCTVEQLLALLKDIKVRVNLAEDEPQTEGELKLIEPAKAE